MYILCINQRINIQNFTNNSLEGKQKFMNIHKKSNTGHCHPDELCYHLFEAEKLYYHMLKVTKFYVDDVLKQNTMDMLKCLIYKQTNAEYRRGIRLKRCCFISSAILIYVKHVGICNKIYMTKIRYIV